MEISEMSEMSIYLNLFDGFKSIWGLNKVSARFTIIFKAIIFGVAL